MYRCKLMLMLSACLLMGLAGVVRADDGDVKAELNALRTRVAELEAKDNGNWLNERRAEEVKGLIHEVLADADTRASLMQDGAVAGHNGSHFFLSSADGAHVLEVWGQVQFRYLLNFENDEPDAEDSGFHIRRAKVGFQGHVTAGRKWDYEVVLVLDSDGDLSSFSGDAGATQFEDVKIGTALKDDLRVDVGHFKIPFLREELNSSKRLTPVERGLVTEFFSGNRAEQIQLAWQSEKIKVAGSISDGFNSGYTTIGNDGAEIAATGRVDVKIEGDWSQMKDYQAWRGEGKAAFVGAALHFETDDAQNAAGLKGFNYFSWTIDGSLEMNGLGVSAALIGGHIQGDPGVADADMYGFQVTGQYMVKDDLEPFVRFEWIDSDSGASGGDQLMALTFGVNYFFKRHNAKFTVDALFFLEVDDGFAGNPIGSSTTDDGLGYTADGLSGGVNEDTILIRFQLQVLF